MANFKKHEKLSKHVGAVAGCVIDLFYQFQRISKNPQAKFDWLELLIYTGGGAVLSATAGMLPDILEPPVHPHHRKTLHSLTIGAVVVTAIIKATKSNLPKSTKYAITTSGCGFISHLVLDSRTIHGLPII